jgi:hypothetical protein
VDEAQLKDQFLKLREEVGRLPPEDAAARTRLGALISDIERRLSNPESSEHDAGLLDNIRETIESFELAYPRTTSILNQLMVTLSNMGI